MEQLIISHLAELAIYKKYELTDNEHVSYCSTCSACKNGTLWNERGLKLKKSPGNHRRVALGMATYTGLVLVAVAVAAAVYGGFAVE